VNELRSALSRLRIPFVVAGILIALFLLGPILVILPVAFTTGTFLKFPPPGFTGGWFREVITDPQWIHPAWLSVQLALLDTLLATIAGTAAGSNSASPSLARSFSNRACSCWTSRSPRWTSSSVRPCNWN
jgi:ABC-type spermidine/putrescine transport system permease subunit II